MRYSSLIIQKGTCHEWVCPSLARSMRVPDLVWERWVQVIENALIKDGDSETRNGLGQKTQQERD